MPTISMFYDIIRMYWNDHMPPHVHAAYQDFSAIFDLDGAMIDGDIPVWQSSYVAAWIGIHHDELAADWNLAQSGESIFKIDPLR